MGRALSIDLRKRIVESRESGVSALETAKRFRVGVSTVRRLFLQWCETGSLEPRVRKGPKPILDDVACELMKGWLREQNDMTLGELCSRLLEHGYEVTLQAVFYCLKRIGLSHKKNDACQ